MVIAITRSGYIKRLPVTTYREQRRGGIGVMGMDLKDEDYIEHLFVASTHDYILFFTSVGKVYRLKVHELPLGSRQSKGRAIVNLLPFRQDEQVRAVDRDARLQGGRVPRLRDEERASSRRRSSSTYNTPLKADGIIAIKLREGDELVGVRHSLGRRRHPDGLAQGPGDPLPRDATCGRWAAPPSGVQRHAAARGRRGDRGQHRRRTTPTCSSSPRTATASARAIAEYPGKGRGGLGVKTVQLTEAQGQARRRARRPRRATR